MSNELLNRRNKLKRSMSKAKQKMMDYAIEISKAKDVPSDAFHLLSSAMGEMLALQRAINATRPEANEVDLISQACKRVRKQKKSKK